MDRESNRRLIMRASRAISESINTSFAVAAGQLDGVATSEFLVQLRVMKEVWPQVTTNWVAAMPALSVEVASIEGTLDDLIAALDSGSSLDSPHVVQAAARLVEPFARVAKAMMPHSG